MEAGVKGTVEVIEPSRAEQALARRAAESRATIPELELAAEADVSGLAAAQRPLLAAVVRAAALALREHPRANAAYRDGRFELYSRVNVGVVLSAAHEPVLATVLDADRKPLAELDEELASLQARAGELTSPERSGATFTVWQAEGVAAASPIITPPHAGALSAGDARTAAVVHDGAIVAGQVMMLTLACDNRILYGSHATCFLAEIRDLLERAEL